MSDSEDYVYEYLLSEKEGEEAEYVETQDCGNIEGNKEIGMSVNDQKNDRSRELWSSVEMECFINIIEEMNIPHLFDSKKFRRDDIFQALNAKLTEMGFSRTLKQVEYKYASMKKEYMKVQRTLGVSGHGTEAKEKCKYYESLHRIFGTRPLVLQDGIDSLPKRASKRDVADCSSTTDNSTGVNSDNKDDGTACFGNESRKRSKSDGERHGEQLKRKKTVESELSPESTKKVERKYTSSKSSVPLHEIANNFATRIAGDQAKLMNEFLAKERAHQSEMQDKANAALAANVSALISGLKDIFQSTPSQFFPQPYVSPGHVPYSTPMTYPNIPNTYTPAPSSAGLAFSTAPPRQYSRKQAKRAGNLRASTSDSDEENKEF